MGLKFNSLGHCLITKETGIKITKDIKQEFKQLKGIKFPQKTTTYDIVEIGNDFKVLDNYTQIYTFRDKKGNIVQRNIINKTPEKIIETKRNYLERPVEVKYVSNGNLTSSLFDKHMIYSRKITSVTKENKEYVYKSEEVQSWTKSCTNNEPIVCITKNFAKPFRNNMELEKQSAYEYTKQGKRGLKTTEYVRTKGGGIDLNGIEYIYENMKPIEKDKYLPVAFYSFKQFKQMAPHIAQNPEHIPPFTYVHWYNRPKTNLGSFNEDTIKLNHKTLTTKPEVIATSAHEKEHAYQRDQRIRYRILEKLRNGEEAYYNFDKLTPDNLAMYEKRTGRKFIDSEEEALKYIEANKNYVQPEDNYNEYYRNYLEEKARDAEVPALSEFFENIKDIKFNFKYMSGSQLSDI